MVAGLPRPRIFLKMDTQGWDAHVLEGAGETLADVVALQSEVSVIPIYHGMRSLLASLASYQALGFELTQLFPVTFDADGLRVIEYDCVLCRPAARATAAASPVDEPARTDPDIATPDGDREGPGHPGAVV